MTVLNKRFRVSNLRLREISTVDRPAQIGAVAVLMKSAGENDVTDTDIRKNAAAIAAGGEPAYGVDDYEDAMLARAAELGAELKCSPEQALSKCITTDAALRDLACATEAARWGAYAAEVKKRHRPEAA
jgi:hypothetical protein